VGFLAHKVAAGQNFLQVLRLWPVSFHQFFTRIFIYEKNLLLAEGQTGEAWKRSRKRSFFGNREAFDRKVLSVFFLLKGLRLVLILHSWSRHFCTR
jgi:hypothetical protein